MNIYYKNIQLDCTNVYEPREDSFLLAKVLETENIKRKDVLDVGCGSGILGIVAAKAGAKVTSVDLKDAAVRATQKNAKTNSVHLTALQSDLLANVDGRYDIIVFNPPYLPFDEKTDSLEGSETWSTGKDLDVYRRFFAEAGAHLSSNGKILIISSSLTGMQLSDIIKENGFSFRVVAEEKVPWETLYVIEARLDEGAMH